MLAALSACSSDAGATVTVTEQVSATSDAGSPTAQPEVTISTDAPDPEPAAGDTSAGGESSTDAQAGETSAANSPTRAAASSQATTKSRGDSTDKSTGKSSTKSGVNPDPGWTNPTTNDPDVSRDVPGPDGGRKCATNADYYDEAPTGLRPDVIAAWHHFEKVANAQGIIVCLNDGKRSSSQQQAQYDEYVREYGKDVADQLVLTPAKSSHVTGVAIDVQPAAAYQFLQSTKGSLGFCRRYDNEAWHFEYDAKYFTQGCPARLPKPER